MNWPQLLFSFKGRITRLYWWVTSLVVSVVSGMLTQGLEFWAREMGAGAIDTDTGAFEPSGAFGIGVGVIALFNLWINFAVSVKRLHDRDRTGWWIVVVYLAIIVAIVLGVATMMQPEGQREPLNGITVIAVFVVSCLMIWMFIEIGFLKGTQGPNRFGPDLLAAPQSDAKI